MKAKKILASVLAGLMLLATAGLCLHINTGCNFC